VAFVSGSFAAVLFLVSLVDPELFLGFEITKDRTVLFYLGLFGTILAISRGMIPEENLVFEPEAMLTQVIEYTHYCPSHWNGRLHSDEVHSQHPHRLLTTGQTRVQCPLRFEDHGLLRGDPKCFDHTVYIMVLAPQLQR